MPRNSQGLYTLPGGNPVQSGTLIESQWANDTMGDIGAALTGSLPRDGSAPMTGPLTLVQGDPVNGRHAASKAYVDKFVAYSTGMPVGSVMAYASGSLPVGFLLCDGSLYQKSDYPELEALIGTTYGGTPGQTFKVPDLRDYFIRGRGPDRTIGSTQAGALGSHVHAVSDPGHSHSFTGTAGNTGTMSANASHSHSMGVAGSHAHSLALGPNIVRNGGDERDGAGNSSMSTNPAGDHTHSISATDTNHTHSFTPAGTVGASATGIQVGATGGTETRPQNMALDYYIKAINDSSTQIGVTSITSSDSNMIAINDSDPAIPELVIKSNVAFGLVKLDSQGKVPLAILPTTQNEFLGYYDASGGSLPVGTFTSGAYYIISVEGTLDVYDPVTNISAPTVVVQGSTIRYVDSAPNPVGWYYVAPTSTMLAADVTVAPIAGLTSDNVQAALAELNTNDATNLAAANSYAVAMAIALG